MSQEEIQRIIDALDDNSFIIRADIHGAKLFARLRGASTFQIGKMLGGAARSLDEQMAALLGLIKDKAGEPGLADFNEGFQAGRTDAPMEMQQTIREVPR